MAHTLKGQFSEALLQVDIAPMSKQTAARLLAALYVHGGANSDWTLNRTLLDDIETARKILHIEGSEVPDAEGAKLLQKATRELAPEGYFGRTFPRPDWLDDISKRYHIRVETKEAAQ